MADSDHQRQHAWHRYRYGVRHWWYHRTGKRHSHKRVRRAPRPDAERERPAEFVARRHRKSLEGANPLPGHGTGSGTADEDAPAPPKWVDRGHRLAGPEETVAFEARLARAAATTEVEEPETDAAKPVDLEDLHDAPSARTRSPQRQGPSTGSPRRRRSSGPHGPDGDRHRRESEHRRGSDRDRSPAEAHRRAASRRRVRRSRRRTVLLGTGVALVLLVVGLAASAVYSILRAEHDLASARDAVQETTASPQSLTSAQARARTMALIQRVTTQLRAARDDLQSSPGLWAMWALPYLHSQRQVLVNLVNDLLTTAGTGQTLLTSLDQLVAESHGTTVSLPALHRLHDQLGTAHTRLAALQHTGGSGFLPLLPGLGSAQASFLQKNAHLVSLLSDGQQLTNYANVFLGGAGPRTYFLAAENNAEMRDQGAILSYALVQAQNGTFSVTTPASVGQLRLRQPAPVPIPPGTDAVFGAYQPTRIWQSTNATADFPWAGSALQGMYRAATGNTVDGVVALDVPGLAKLLKVVGPVRVPGIARPVTSANVSKILLHDEYQGFAVDNNQGRQDFIASVAKAAVDKMKAGHVDLAAFVNALSSSVAGRHLLAWDSVPSNETTITKFGGSGAIDAVDPRRAFHVAVEDGSPNKLDYYVNISVSQQVVVEPSGAAAVTTTVTGHNSVPPGSKPSYQLGPDGFLTHTAGQYLGRVYLWGPRGSVMNGSIPESGLRVQSSELNLLPGATASVQFLTIVPHAVDHGHLRLVYVPQPRLHPETLRVRVAGQGWQVGGPVSVHAPLTKTRSWSWSVGR